MHVTRINVLKSSAAAMAALGLIGCSSQGLSSRESGVQTYSNIVHATPPNDSTLRSYSSITGGTALTLPSTQPVQLDLPARVSVVQIGEIAPPQSMLRALRAQKQLFCQVSPQSGMEGDAQGEPQRRLEQMRVMAQSTGTEYLLVFGGNVDSGSQATGLAALNLTVIGCFVAPGTAVAVDGKAAGSLVDNRTGRVVMNFSSETSGHGLTPTAFAENVETASVVHAREELVTKLADDVILQMKAQSQSGEAMNR